MSALAELQRAFVRELFGDGARLRPYRETTLGALCDALAAIHPVCVRLVGADAFRALARRCAGERPSRSPDLNDYGAELADVIAGFPPARALPYLPDVARLEWALHRARHAALASAIATADLTERARLGLAPGTALLASPWPIDRIWETNQPEFRGDTEVRLDAGEVRLLVAREPEGADFSRLTTAEFDLLEGLGQGHTLERAAVAWSGSAESLGAVLARALGRRWLA